MTPILPNYLSPKQGKILILVISRLSSLIKSIPKAAPLSEGNYWSQLTSNDQLLPELSYGSLVHLLQGSCSLPSTSRIFLIKSIRAQFPIPIGVDQLQDTEGHSFKVRQSLEAKQSKWTNTSISINNCNMIKPKSSSNLDCPWGHWCPKLREKSWSSTGRNTYLRTRSRPVFWSQSICDKPKAWLPMKQVLI